MNNLINAYLDMWRNYFNFSGRTNVPGYWWAVLGNLIVGFVVGFLPALIVDLYSLAVLIPGLALCVRRLNDIGKKWYWLLLNFIPLVGQIILIVLFCKPSVGTSHPVEF